MTDSTDEVDCYEPPEPPVRLAAAEATVEILPTLPRHAFTIASPSQINTFRDCERKWYFQKVLKLWEPSSAAQRQGTRTHSELEEYVLGKRTADQLCPEALELLQYLPEDLGRVFQTDKGISLIETLKVNETGYTIVEPHFNIQRPEWPVPVQGLIDFLHVPKVPGKALVISDYKTSGNLSYVPLAEKVVYDPQKVIYSEVGFLHPLFEDVTFSLLYTKKLKGKGDSPASRKVSVTTNKEQRHGLEEVTKDLHRMVEASGLDLKDTKVNTASCGKYNGCPYAHLCDKGGEQEITVMGLFNKLAGKQAAIDTASQATPPTNPALAQNPGTVFNPAPAATPPAAAAPASPFAKVQGNPFAVKQPAQQAPAPEQVSEKSTGIDPIAVMRELASVPVVKFPEVKPPRDKSITLRENVGGRRTRAEIFRDRILTLIHEQAADGKLFFHWNLLSETHAEYIGKVQEWYPLSIEFPESLDDKHIGSDYIHRNASTNTKTLAEIAGEEAPDAPVQTPTPAVAPAPIKSSVFGPKPAATQPAPATPFAALTPAPVQQAPSALPTTHDAAQLDAVMKGKPAYILFVGCVPLKTGAVDLSTWLGPIKAEIEQRSGLPYWNLQEFGKGKQELAAKVKQVILTGGAEAVPNLYASGLDSSLDEVLAVLSEYAVDVIRRC